MGINVKYVGKPGAKLHALYDYGHDQHATKTLCNRDVEGEFSVPENDEQICATCAEHLQDRASTMVIDMVSSLASDMLAEADGVWFSSWVIRDFLTRYRREVLEMHSSWEMSRKISHLEKNAAQAKAWLSNPVPEK